jgi:GDP-D-mannose dehydratase
MRHLIARCEGLVWSHLADLLIGKGVLVYGTPYNTTSLNHLKKVITLSKSDPKHRERAVD